MARWERHGRSDSAGVLEIVGDESLTDSFIERHTGFARVPHDSPGNTLLTYMRPGCCKLLSANSRRGDEYEC